MVGVGGVGLGHEQLVLSSVADQIAEHSRAEPVRRRAAFDVWPQTRPAVVAERRGGDERERVAVDVPTGDQ